MALKAGRPSGRTDTHLKDLKDKLDDEVRLNVRMERSEYRRLKQFAFDLDVSISKVVRDAISEYMSRASHES